MAASQSKKEKINYSLAGKKVAIVVSRYHEDITQTLLDGALSSLESYGLSRKDVDVRWAPGSFELPLVARAVLQRQDRDAVICLGLILRGETKHFDFIAAEVARGIANVAQASGTPVIFGVLTTDTLEQAKERTGGKHGHKGSEAAESAVAMIQTLEEIKNTKPAGSKNVGFL